ncbi:MAG: phosphotransferase [Hellea sp.]
MSRETEIIEFLKDANWHEAARSPVSGDASTRRYERLNLNGKIAVLMDAPKGMEAPSEPEGASVADRKALGYNALARLAGPNAEAFACIANELTKRGFSAPKIIAADLEKGFMLLEDLGDDLYARVIEKNPLIERKLYEGAVDTLAAIYRSSFPKEMTFKNYKWRVRDYDTAAMLAEVDLFLDWYAKDFGHDIEGRGREEWHELWKAAFASLDAHAPGLALRDFHAENIFWLPEREATARVGLIDFQDGLFAHPAYDLTSLLDDARRDVNEVLKWEMMARFCEKAGIPACEKFTLAYYTLAAQRNTKILGIFVRLAKRDGKTQYRDLIPRVEENLRQNLGSMSELLDLENWFEDWVPELGT